MSLAPRGTLRLIQLWLIVFNSLSIVLGLLLVFASSAAFFSGYRESLAEVFWGSRSVPASSAAYFSWSMALIGAATVGWAITNLFIVVYALGRPERWAFVAIGLGTLGWAALEIIVSARAGAHAEIYFVMSAAGSVIVPALLGWRMTRPQRR